MVIAVFGTAVAAIAIGFFAGVKYQQSRLPRPSFGDGQSMMIQRGARGQMAMRGGTAMVRPTSGEIIDSDEKSITVKMDDGSSAIVMLSDSTSIQHSSDASRSALTTGTKVAVFGLQNSDGSVTAQSIQLNPKQFELRKQR